MGTGREKPVLVQCLAHCREKMERVMGIEPTLAAWEAAVLPLNYTRVTAQSKRTAGEWQCRGRGARLRVGRDRNARRRVR